MASSTCNDFTSGNNHKLDWCKRSLIISKLTNSFDTILYEIRILYTVLPPVYEVLNNNIQTELNFIRGIVARLIEKTFG